MLIINSKLFFEDYYRILAGNKAMNACHVALNSSKIALNRPELKSEIIDNFSVLMRSIRGNRRN
jgi:hypothetical protein